MPLIRNPITRNAITVDVEDYFHADRLNGLVPRHRWERLESRVCANTSRLLSIFDAAGVRGTFFVLGWVADRFPSLVREIAAAGHDVATHGYAHRLAYDLTRDSFRDDLRRGKATLEATLGRAVEGHRAAGYSITPLSLWAIDVLIEEGVLYDCSISPVRHNRYGIPASPRHAYWIERPAGSLLEIPASTIRCGGFNVPVGSGMSLRALPYGWTVQAIRWLNAVEHRPAIVSLSSWEIDEAQPRLEPAGAGRVRRYWNLRKTADRLARLLRDVPFGPIADVLREPAAGVRADSVAESLPYLW
jgi:polysaccharide deacetylase family protein (PEP-CTERM system associated)